MSGRIGAENPRSALRSVGTLGLVAAGVVAIEHTTGLVPPCPFLELTGWYCPLCGSTRLGLALLHGDVVAAFWWNPLVFAGGVVLSLLSLSWLWQVRAGRGHLGVVAGSGGGAVRPRGGVGSAVSTPGGAGVAQRISSRVGGAPWRRLVPSSVQGWLVLAGVVFTLVRNLA